MNNRGEIWDGSIRGHKFRCWLHRNCGVPINCDILNTVPEGRVVYEKENNVISMLQCRNNSNYHP